jgi:hypothetical protein
MSLADRNSTASVPVTQARKQAEARRVADKEIPFKCCAVCGLQIEASLQIAHLDHNAGNNRPDNLARLCPTHHGMYDADLYLADTIRLLQSRWQETEGKPNHKGRMKNAGAKAALTRKRTVSAKKAVATRRANIAATRPKGVPNVE